MFITITTSKATPEQLQEVETFLHEFLSRLKQLLFTLGSRLPARSGAPPR